MPTRLVHLVPRSIFNAQRSGPAPLRDHAENDPEDIVLPIRLQTTRPHLGGVRWWFTCPLISSGIACEWRVAKLYLPPGSRHFGCRTCHDLTYQSCQQAHQIERLLDPRRIEKQWARLRRLNARLDRRLGRPVGSQVWSYRQNSRDINMPA